VFELVAGLVDKSILARENHGRSARYRMLDTIHAYGRDRLRETGEHAELGERHRDYYLGLAERSATTWFGPDQVEISERTRREHANLRIALDFCLNTPAETQTGLRLAAALLFYWSDCGFLTEGRHWLDRALALDTEPTRTRAMALWTSAYVAVALGSYRSAACMADECRALALRLGDETALAYAELMLGIATSPSGDHARAIALIEEALTRFEAVGELNCTVVHGYVALAGTLALRGESARAVTVSRQAIAICESKGEQSMRAWALYVLSWAEWSRGELEPATTHAQESLRLKTFNDHLGTAIAVELLAWIAATAGDVARRGPADLGVDRRPGPVWFPELDHPAPGMRATGPPRSRRPCLRNCLRSWFRTRPRRRGRLRARRETRHQGPCGNGRRGGVVDPAGTPGRRAGRRGADQQTDRGPAGDRQRTAEGHVERILTKLGFTKRVQIAA
jgi:hypothetical protein